MKIKDKALTDVYYLMFFWATKETIENDIYFINKDIMLDIRKKSHLLIYKKQKQHQKVKKETLKLLHKIQKLSISMEKLSFEMIVYISLNWLKNELEEKDCKNIFKDIDTISILEFIREKYPTELKEHYKFFELLEDSLGGSDV
jgi:hypothetical protein